MRVVYRMDYLEPEPPQLLRSLLFKRVLTMFPILILEILADEWISSFLLQKMGFLFLSCFIVPGFIEEEVKRWVLLRRTWNDPNFNVQFDGVIYAVFVSLGFAAVENSFYVLDEVFFLQYFGPCFPYQVMPCLAWLWGDILERPSGWKLMEIFIHVERH